MRIVVIHGPQATGKTLHASRFAEHYGCARTLDWTHAKQHEQPLDGDLLLTIEPPAKILRALPDATLIPVNVARAAIGLDPAPAGGFPPIRDVPLTAAILADLGVKVPLRADVAYPGTIVDAAGRDVCVVDYNGEQSDGAVTSLAGFIADIVNDSAKAVTIIRKQIIDTPETADFMAGVPIEAAHQRERWGSEHDAGKTPFDWFWLIGYLAQKAADAAVRGDLIKAKHHTISTAAALANWHAALSEIDTSMRPGVAHPVSEAGA
jgi:hypothetical protein